MASDGFAGIYESLRASTYPLTRQDNNLIFELALRWCEETNTFAFPWGEATITLEDVMILGGFSLLGVSPLTLGEEDEESLEMQQQLEEARREVQRSKSRKALQSRWMVKFKGNGCKLEDQALLCYWLSRFVFPHSSAWLINRRVFPIAIQLARGTKIALGPAILSMLYKDLTILRKKLMGATEGADVVRPLDLWAPFRLLEFWVWERFPKLRPTPNLMYTSTEIPRLARWSKVKKNSNDEDLRSVFDSAETTFVWRPYSQYDDHEGVEGEWVSVDDDKHLDENAQLLYRCVKISILVGFTCCTEKYLPHRVARQFGFDQDIPIHVDIPTDENFDPVTAWRNYSKPIDEGTKLYVPSRTFNPSITHGYHLWCKRHPFPLMNLLDKGEKDNDEEYVLPPPGFPPKINVIVIDSDSSQDDEEDDDVYVVDDDDQLTRSQGAKGTHARGSCSRKPLSSISLDNEFFEGMELFNQSPSRHMKLVEVETMVENEIGIEDVGVRSEDWNPVCDDDDDDVMILDSGSDQVCEILTEDSKDKHRKDENTSDARSSVHGEGRGMTGSCKGSSFRGTSILNESVEVQSNSVLIEEGRDDIQVDQVKLGVTASSSDIDKKDGMDCGSVSSGIKKVGNFRFDLENRIIRLERIIAEIREGKLLKRKPSI